MQLAKALMKMNVFNIIKCNKFILILKSVISDCYWMGEILDFLN